MIHFDFAFYLTLAVIVTGVVSLLDKLTWAKRRAVDQSMPMLIDYARSFFPVLLFVWIIRSFLVQPYRVPTGSLEPTIMPGDFIAVSQFSYGLRLPVLHTKIMAVGNPQHGNIALFHWPPHPKIIFVKRVIGVPGDHIVYHHKVLTINGVVCKQKFIRKTYDYYSGPMPRPVNLMQEDLLGHKHYIWVQAYGGETQDINVTVPAGKYFMMGDNRDDSDDSRMWGFVPDNNLIGKAMFVWMSWDTLTNSVRWKRIGTRL